MTSSAGTKVASLVGQDALGDSVVTGRKYGGDSSVVNAITGTGIIARVRGDGREEGVTGEMRSVRKTEITNGLMDVIIGFKALK